MTSVQKTPQRYILEKLYHEVDVAVFTAEIIHELLEATFLPAHLEHRDIRWQPVFVSGSVLYSWTVVFCL